MSFKWTVSPTQAFVPGAAAYVAAIRRGVWQLAKRYEPEIEQWMKDNASWTDQSSNARQSLNTDVQQVGQDMVTIILAHGMTYGIFLELANQGRYAIIAPSLDLFAPRIWNDVRAMLS